MREAFRAASLLLAIAVVLGAGGAAAGDEALGAYLAGTCVACHRGGTAEPAIPDLSSLSEDQMVAAMQAYRLGERVDAVMQAIATTLSDAEAAAVAQALAAEGQPK